LYAGPGPVSVFDPMLGPMAGTIACVGVAGEAQGQGIGTAMVTRASELLREAGTRVCHIGWTTREAFYARAGYTPGGTTSCPAVRCGNRPKRRARRIAIRFGGPAGAMLAVAGGAISPSSCFRAW